jgi:mannose-6-phosphate isomerase-like protein (cupin superfamily)
MKLLPGPEGKRFARVLEHGSMEVEVYEPRGSEPQTPRARNELYVVVEGTGEFVNGPHRHPFGPGTVLFVTARVEHWFEGFTDNLVVWIVFYGPEGGERTMMRLHDTLSSATPTRRRCCSRSSGYRSSESSTI